MRLAISALCGIFLSAIFIGCGSGDVTTTPPSDAKAGPPPGTSPDATKIMKKKCLTKRNLGEKTSAKC